MSTNASPAAVQQARQKLDAHVREIVQWHFNPETGTPFWLERAKSFKFNPLKDVNGFDDLKLFGHFEDEWLRGGPVRRWVPKALQQKPIYVFETGGTTGIPKTRINIDDFRADYEQFSHTLPDEFFPKGSNWLMLGPSGPRRLRLAVLVTGGLYLVVTAVRLIVLREDVDRLTSLGLVVGSLVAVWASVNVITGLLERRRSRAGR